MAIRVGVSRPTVRRLESGDLTVSLAVLARISRSSLSMTIWTWLRRRTNLAGG